MAKRGLILLALGYVSAFAWLAFEWQRPVPLPEPPGPATSVDLPQPAPPHAQLGDLEAFNELVERPLFVLGRKPVAADTTADSATAEPQAPTMIASELTGTRLTAILVDGIRFMALVEQRDGTTVQLREGSLLDAWRVQEIKDDSIVLGANGRTETLQVYQFDVAPPPSPRLTARARRAAIKAQRRLSRGVREAPRRLSPGQDPGRSEFPDQPLPDEAPPDEQPIEQEQTTAEEGS